MLRKARIEDVRLIHAMVNLSATRGEMLTRSLGELYDNLRDYVVCEDNGTIVGTCALHICWEDLCEIRSLCVSEPFRKLGIGRRLVDACLEEARSFDVSRVFVLTYQVRFFEHCGFHAIDKKELPQKIWSDCIKCHKFPACDENAMVLRLPKEG